MSCESVSWRVGKASARAVTLNLITGGFGIGAQIPKACVQGDRSASRGRMTLPPCRLKALATHHELGFWPSSRHVFLGT